MMLCGYEATRCLLALLQLLAVGHPLLAMRRMLLLRGGPILSLNLCPLALTLSLSVSLGLRLRFSLSLSLHLRLSLRSRLRFRLQMRLNRLSLCLCQLLCFDHLLLLLLLSKRHRLLRTRHVLVALGDGYDRPRRQLLRADGQLHRL